MILIRAKRESGELIFTVLSFDGRESFMTGDSEAAEEKLLRIYGIADAKGVLRAAAKWGALEVPEGIPDEPLRMKIVSG